MFSPARAGDRRLKGGGPGGDLWQKRVGILVIVHPAAKMPETIAHYKITRMKHHIVSRYLIEYFLCDCYCRCFIFYYHKRRAVAVEHYCVASTLGIIERQRHLIIHKRSWITEIVGHPGCEMLSHVFLRCQCHIFLSEGIKYLKYIPFHSETQIYRGKI